ncbi:MAG: PDZ domain-containing protein [Bacillota bacterium]
MNVPIQKKTMILRSLSTGTLVTILLLLSSGCATTRKPHPSIDLQITIVQQIAPSLVTVQYTLQYDKGESPYGSGWASRCPNCGRYHGEDVDQYVQQERPLEINGFLISSTRVVSADLMLHPRFIKSVAVRFGQEVVDARPVAYPKEQNAVILELAKPLKDTKPLAFDPTRKGPYLTLTRTQLPGDWATNIGSLSTAITTTETGRRFIATPSYCLITDQSGAPVALSMNDEIPADETWKTAPENWPAYTKPQLDALVAGLEKQTSAAIVRVALGFRSPRSSSLLGRFSHRSRDEDENAMPRDVPGLRLDRNRVLVLAHLKPNVTARLERITLYPPTGKALPAKFTCTLADYGGFIATLEKPLPDALPLASTDIRDAADKLLFGAEIRIQGEKRTAYITHRRIASFQVGWHQQIYPELPGTNQHVPFLLDAQGALLAIPIALRQKASLERQWDHESSVLTAARYLDPVIRDAVGKADPANVPLSEQDENRLAWMGVELQALNKELAQANNVSDLTSDGQSGALVTYVHPDSPAAQAGIEAGSILLRLYPEDQPKPLEVKLEDYYESENFPWDRFDEVPEQYFEQIPQPWPSADNSLNRVLTELGVGKKYAAEFFHHGQLIKREFQVAAGPTHYDSAPRYKAAALGVTVRDLTYEVRRHFQLKATDPGVIISKVEQGGKASTSGIKPFEIITHINNQPVMNVQEFQKFSENQTELRLSVKRMLKGRQIKISLPARKEGSPTTRPADQGE